MEADRTGPLSPVGLSYSSNSSTFYVVEEQGQAPTTNSDVIAITPLANRRGVTRIAAIIEDPLNMVFDNQNSRLLAFQPTTNELLEVRENPSGNLDRTTVIRHNARRFGIQDSQGMTLDEANGGLFILDAVGPRIVRVQLGPGRNFTGGRISVIDLQASGLVSPRGIAFDPSTGHLHVLDLIDQRLYELTQTGQVITTRNLVPFLVKSPQGMVFAPSGDQTDAPSQMSLFLSDSGLISGRGGISRSISSSQLPAQLGASAQSTGEVLELSMIQPAAAEASSFQSSLIQMTDLSTISPPNPDASGVAYLPLSNSLIVVDGEVEETVSGITHFQGANVWELTRGGSVIRTANISPVSPTVVPMSDEPTGVAWNPNNGHYYVSDDTGSIDMYDLNAGADGLVGTSDDSWVGYSLSSVGVGDAEGIAYDTWNNTLFVADGVNAEVYQFTLSGTLINHFDVAGYGVVDPEAVEFNPYTGTLYVMSSNRSTGVIVETTTDGTLLQTIDISPANIRTAAGLAYAPASNGSGAQNFYIVDRGVDNDSNPSLIDGKLYEITAPPSGPAPTSTNTLTATNTRTPTNTSTQGPSPTSTNTLPPTNTPTATGTPTITATPTNTPVSSVVTLTAVADARVLETSPTTNYGTLGRLDVDNPGQESYIRFTVSGVTGTIQNATLRLFVTNGSANGPSIYGTDNTWTETGITWNNRPAATTGVIFNLGAATASTWAEYNVTAYITGNGTYSFVLLPDSTDGVTFTSREGTSPPQLVLTFATGPTPTPTNTPTATTTFTPTNTPTNTLTPTDTPTPTATHTSTDTPTPGPTSTPTNTPLPTATFTPTNTFTPTPTSTPTLLPSSNAFLASFASSGTVGGVAFGDEDILEFDGSTWRLLFDGSDVGVGAPDVFAFYSLDPDSILLAFTGSVTVGGQTYAPTDIVRFDATSLGDITAGTFSLYFNGIDVGLDASTDNIDAIEILPDGRLLVSTTGNPSVPGLTGLADEDILVFNPTTLGSTTSGTWTWYFDGSDVALANTSEDIDALDVDSNGNIYISTLGDFAVTGIAGFDEDVFVCSPTSLGSVTACNYSPVLFFDGDTWGLSTNDLDAFHRLGSGSFPTATPTNTGTPTNTPTSTPTATNTSIPTSTFTPTDTPTPGPSPTPTNTPTRTDTPTATSTSLPTNTPTNTPVSSVITLAAVADSRVMQISPDTNDGTLPQLDIDNPGEESYIRFTVSGITGTVQNATLRVFVTNGSSNGPSIYGTDNSWTETGITWNNRPAATTGAIANLGAATASTWAEYDLTAYITGNGTYSFVFLPDSTDGIRFVSREGSSPPQLVLTLTSGPAPTPTNTATPGPAPTSTSTPTPTNTPSSGSVVFVGAGDISDCSRVQDEQTAQLLDNIPGTVYTVGDNAYPNGSAADFNNCYEPTWGRHKARTFPAIGDNEYNSSSTAAGHFGYFGAVAGTPGEGYYSFNLGSWHIIVLNSECSQVGGCGTNSPQWQWLQADLAANPSACTLAIHHKPLFSSNTGDTDMRDFWVLLYQAGADVVLSGHRHMYERFALQNPDGVADSGRGIRQFVVGTGGSSLSSLDGIAPNSEVRNDQTYGVLKFTLHPSSYDWEFIPIAGQTFSDSGSASCVIP